METIRTIYTALTIFGAGVTIVDLFGALDIGAHADGHDGGHDGSHDGGHDGFHDAGHDSGHDFSHDLGHDGSHDEGYGSGHVDHGSHDGHDGGVHDHLADAPGSVLGTAHAEPPAPESFGMVSSGLVARLIGILRTGVYFSLGAGPTGLIALVTGHGVGASVFWSLGAGTVIAAGARLLRRFVRHDLDSSFRPEDFILEEAKITVSVAPGLMGKAVVLKYGPAAEVFVRAEDGSSAFARGSHVRIIDYHDDCYLVEAAETEHLVH